MRIAVSWPVVRLIRGADILVCLHFETAPADRNVCPTVLFAELRYVFQQRVDELIGGEESQILWLFADADVLPRQAGAFADCLVSRAVQTFSWPLIW